MKQFKLLTFIVFVLIAVTAQADQVYKMVKPDGSVVFSDEPFEGSEAVDVKPLPTFDMKPVNVQSLSKNPESTPKGPMYEKLVITNPANDTVVRNNEGVLSLQISIAPTLQAGHGIVIIQDGKKVEGPSQKTAFMISNVFRGSHQFAAQIVDESGKVLKSSSPVTVHMKQFSTTHKANSSQPNNSPTSNKPQNGDAPK